MAAPAHAQVGLVAEVIDHIVTGAITTTPAATAQPGGSEAFRAGLDQLEAGEAEAAFAAAARLPSTSERRTLQWAAIYYGEGRIPHDAVAAFLAESPDFGAGGVLKSRLERALTRADADPQEVIDVLGGAMPNTTYAQIALASAYQQAGETERAAGIARSLWVDNFLDQDTEKVVLSRLGELLTPADHWDRAVHLMMHDRATGAERLLGHFNDKQKSLVVARNAVSRKAANAKALLDAVDPEFQTHPVFLYSRAQRARQAELWESAVDWLNKAEGTLPDAGEWWYERRTVVRQLLQMGQPELAFKAADGYREGPSGRLVEAHFHAGWIALSFLGRAEDAAEHFEAMSANSTLPDSVTQANYWLGRARLALGDEAGAREAFGRAAEYTTVYYGQLARAELGLPSVELRQLPTWQDSAATFEARDVVQAIRLLTTNGDRDMAMPLVRNLANSLSDGGELLLAARLAQSLGAHDVAIAIADTAERRGVPLDFFSFPKDGMPAEVQTAEVDNAAIYAIARQESRFRSDAVSSAGARGLMQLMPGTAREVAGKLGLDYSANRLTSDPAYNTLLGSTYLQSQLSRFDGSLVLAAAAYNAGAGNAIKWINAYGDPREDNVDPVVWVELIPFQETRKYVQRVMGNYLVYRARLGDSAMSIKAAMRSIEG